MKRAEILVKIRAVERLMRVLNVPRRAAGLTEAGKKLNAELFYLKVKLIGARD